MCGFHERDYDYDKYCRGGHAGRHSQKSHSALCWSIFAITHANFVLLISAYTLIHPIGFSKDAATTKSTEEPGESTPTA